MTSGSESGNNTGTLNRGIVIAAIAGLFIGSVSAFGIYSRIIETPLQQENENLKAEILQIELDRSDAAQSVSGYEDQTNQDDLNDLNEQIEALRSQLDTMAASNEATLQELQLELEKSQAQYRSALKSLQRERQRNQNPADGWSGKYN